MISDAFLFRRAFGGVEASSFAVGSWGWGALAGAEGVGLGSQAWFRVQVGTWAALRRVAMNYFFSCLIKKPQ